MLEKSAEAGHFFRKFPIHRKLISINKVNNCFEEAEFNMRHDWNSLVGDKGKTFSQYTDELFPCADLAVTYFNDFAKNHDLPIRYNTTVKQVSKKGDVFHIELDSGEVLTTKILLLGTGSYNVPWWFCEHSAA